MQKATRGGLAVLAAIGGAAWAWVGFGLTIAGDYFEAGFGLLLGMALCAGAAGFGAWRIQHPVARVALVVVLSLPLAFLAVAPSGWWAHGPPPVE